MKRNIIGGAFTLASLMLAGHALAEDGVVHFVGEIVDTTCEVTSDTADQIVPLGKVIDWPPESPDNQYHLFK